MPENTRDKHPDVPLPAGTTAVGAWHPDDHPQHPRHVPSDDVDVRGVRTHPHASQSSATRDPSPRASTGRSPTY